MSGLIFKAASVELAVDLSYSLDLSVHKQLSLPTVTHECAFGVTGKSYS
jgi:hypothetical protein